MVGAAGFPRRGSRARRARRRRPSVRHDRRLARDDRGDEADGPAGLPRNPLPLHRARSRTRGWSSRTSSTSSPASRPTRARSPWTSPRPATACAWWSRWTRCTATSSRGCRRKASRASSRSSTSGSREPPQSLAGVVMVVAIPPIPGAVPSHSVTASALLKQSAPGRVRDSWCVSGARLGESPNKWGDPYAARNATTSTGTASLKLNRDPLGSQFLNDSADAFERTRAASRCGGPRTPRGPPAPSKRRRECTR